MRLSPGEKLGPYEILAQVGEGGMGAVYKARDTRLNRTVAIKVSNEEFSERFEREAHAVASLNHPNICTLHDVGPNYLVMEFIEGKPLQGPLPAEKAIACAIQIVEALDAAHRKGITHRDLKPGNILVTKQGVKLLDFGLAKSLSSARPAGDATLTQALTEKGIVLGTVPYMSPEQFQGEPADARSDIFSFGIVFYELLTGRRPFEGKSQANLMAAILEREPPPVEGVPPALDLLIRHCLAKDPDARWQSAHDLALELKSLQDRTPEQTAKVRHPIPWIAAAAVLGLVAAWGWYAALRNPPEEREPRHFELYPPPGTQFITPRDGRGSLAVSPDGRSIVFGAERNRQRSLWLHSLVTNESKEMEGSEGGFGPFWSPDSRQIAFVAEERLQLYSLDGGRPVSLAPTGNRFFGGYWSPEGPIIFSSASGGFQSVSPEGGDPKTILKPDAAKDEIFYAHPQAHADGRSFLFTVIAKRYDESFFGIASLSQPVRRTALPRVPSVIATRYAFDRSNSYFLHVRNQRIVVQKVDPGSLAPATEAVAIAGPTEVATFRGFCPIAVASDKVLAYVGPDFQEGQLTWYSRDGREMGTVGSPAS
jgi:serine/threonine protein kinase